MAAGQRKRVTRGWWAVSLLRRATHHRSALAQLVTAAMATAVRGLEVPIGAAEDPVPLVDPERATIAVAVLLDENSSGAKRLCFDPGHEDTQKSFAERGSDAGHVQYPFVGSM